jgi:hypothetical protein
MATNISWEVTGFETGPVTTKDRGTGDSVVVQDVVHRVDFLVTATNDAGTTGKRRDAVILGKPQFADEAILANAEPGAVIYAVHKALGGAVEACEADAAARIGLPDDAEEEAPADGE